MHQLRNVGQRTEDEHHQQRVHVQHLQVSEESRQREVLFINNKVVREEDHGQQLDRHKGEQKKRPDVPITLQHDLGEASVLVQKVPNFRLYGSWSNEAQSPKDETVFYLLIKLSDVQTVEVHLVKDDEAAEVAEKDKGGQHQIKKE